MFVSSVLNHSHRTSNPLAGGMHLNALNGSADVLGCNNNNDDQDVSTSENAFGGLFGVSLCDNHPYRPLDSGRSFLDSRKLTPNPEENSRKNRIKESFLSSSLNSGRRREYELKDCIDVQFSPLSLRRHSLNIDTDRISTHAQCGSELSLSLEDISTPSCNDIVEDKSSRVKDDRHQLDHDFTRLSITQVDIDTTDPGLGHNKHGHHHHHHSGRKSKRTHFTSADTLVPSERAVKILDKIKDGKKSEHSKSRHRNSTSSSFEKLQISRPSSTSRYHVTPRNWQDISSSTSKKTQRPRTHKGTTRHVD